MALMHNLASSYGQIPSLPAPTRHDLLPDCTLAIRARLSSVQAIYGIQRATSDRDVQLQPPGNTLPPKLGRASHKRHVVRLMSASEPGAGSCSRIRGR